MPPRSAISSSRRLSLLSGTFYSVDSLSPLFRAISHANPFFYVISGFRYGFLGVADSPVLFGALLLLAINVALGALCFGLLSERLEARRPEIVSFIQLATIMNGFCRARSAPPQRPGVEAGLANVQQGVMTCVSF